MWLLAEKLGIDSNFSLKIAADVAEGFWNPNYGTIGGTRAVGGRCLPKDVRILQSIAEDVSTDMSILKAVLSVNSKMEEMAEVSDIPIEFESGTRQLKPLPQASELNKEQIL